MSDQTMDQTLDQISSQFAGSFSRIVIPIPTAEVSQTQSLQTHPSPAEGVITYRKVSKLEIFHYLYAGLIMGLLLAMYLYYR